MTTPHPAPAKSPRPYQGQAVSAVQAHWAAGRRRVVVALPTGAGKTYISGMLLAPAAARGAAVVFVHTLELRSQARAAIPGARVLTIQGAVRAGVPIVAPPGAGPLVVFIDECHHIAAGRWRRLLALLPADALVVGMTATPERADGSALGDAFDALVSTTTYTALVRAGHLAPCRVVPAPGMSPAEAYLQHGDRRPGLIFSPTVERCNAAVLDLLRAGVRAAVIAGTTAPAAREWAVAAFAAGDLDVLASPMALAEGFDAPRAAVCVLDRQCEHVSTYLQIANRVTRAHPTKMPAALGGAAGSSPAMLVDLHGAAARHGNPLEDRTYSLAGKAIGRVLPPAPAPRRAAPVRVAPSVAAGRVVGTWARRAGAWLMAALAA